jgi:hypothetical protein
MDSTSFQKSLDAYAKKKRGKKLTEKEIKDLRKPEPSKVTKEMIEAIMSEKPPKNIIRKLSSEDLNELKKKPTPKEAKKILDALFLKSPRLAKADGGDVPSAKKKSNTSLPPWDQLTKEDKRELAKEFGQPSITKQEYLALQGMERARRRDMDETASMRGIDLAKGGVVKSKKKKSSKSKKPNALAVTIIIPTGSTNKKASMMSGGMANKRNHMYPGGGHVTDKRKGK